MQVAQLEYGLHHDSMPLTEEKKTIQEIRRLKSQRERVRAYEAQQRELEAERQASRQAAQDAPQQPTSTSLRELEGERKVSSRLLEANRCLMMQAEHNSSPQHSHLNMIYRTMIVS